MRGALNGLLIVLLCGAGAFALVVHKQNEKRDRAAAAQRVAEAAEAAPPLAAAPVTPRTLAPVPASPAPPEAPAPIAAEPIAQPIAAAPAPSAGPNRKPVLPYWYEGARGWEAARKEQLDANAPLLVYFHTTWCGWCKKLERELLPSLGVERVLRDVVKVKLDPEAGADERALATRFGVRGYPSVYVLAGPRAMPIKLQPFASDGSAPPAEFLLQLERAGATALP